jgi:hypothetical protein
MFQTQNLRFPPIYALTSLQMRNTAHHCILFFYSLPFLYANVDRSTTRHCGYCTKTRLLSSSIIGHSDDGSWMMPSCQVRQKTSCSSYRVSFSGVFLTPSALGHVRHQLWTDNLNPILEPFLFIHFLIVLCLDLSCGVRHSVLMVYPLPILNLVSP